MIDPETGLPVENRPNVYDIIDLDNPTVSVPKTAADQPTETATPDASAEPIEAAETNDNNI